MARRSPIREPTPVEETRGRPLVDSVLEHIWYHRELSRADIARSMGLARSTASDIVSRLLETSLVAESGDGPSRGGRRPVLLEFQYDAFVILGVDMGATHVTVVLSDLNGRILSSHGTRHPVRSDPDGTLEIIHELADRCLDEVEGAGDRLLGLGVAAPCPVDPAAPHLLSEVVLPDWAGHPGLSTLEARFDVPVLIDNDANLGALAEAWWGAGASLDDFTFIKLATGIGSGHIIGGHIYRGSSGVAGEIGHVSIDSNGPPCVCGNRGCLTTFVGTEALLARARSLETDYPDSAVSGDTAGIQDLEDAALAGDPLAVQVTREAATHLGTAIAGLLNLMNPGAVILGGSLSRLGDILLRPLREAVMSRTLVSSLASTEIRCSALGVHDVALGAATHVLQAALDDPTLFPDYVAS